MACGLIRVPSTFSAWRLNLAAMTTIVDSHHVRAPEELAGDLTSALDFLAGEIFLANIYGNESVEIVAAPEVLPTLAEAAGAFDADELPDGFRLREG